MSLRSREFLLLASAALLAFGSSSAAAQGEPRSVRIGVLFYTMPAHERAATPTGRALVQGLADKGWIVGRNARIEWRSADSNFDRIPALVEELVRMPVDILVVSGNDFAAESVRRSPSLPVVMASADYPVENGLIASLARPGGSITGISNWVGRDLNAKRLALLKESAPTVKRVAVLAGLAGISRAKFSTESQAAADALGVSLFKIGADRLADFEPAFEAAVQSGAGAVFVVDYPPAFAEPNQRRISELAIRHRLPVIHSASTAANAGALLTYGPDISDQFRRAGHLVDKILRGAKPGDIPFEEPARLDLVVNLKAARAIGLTIPPSILIQAARVID